MKLRFKFNRIVLTICALFSLTASALANTPCISGTEKSECVLAADFGLRAETVVVGALPKDSDIIIKEPKNKQIVKWVDSYLFTDGLTRDQGDEGSKAGVLTGYVSGGWNPWGYKQFNNQCCVVNDCNMSHLQPGDQCLGIGTEDKIGKIVDDNVQTKRIPCVLKDGYGLYGLIALENNGEFADPNNKENLELDPNLFRTFRLGKLYDVSAGKTNKTMKRFEVKYTQQWDAELKAWKIDEKNGVPYIPRGKIYFKIYDNYYQDNYGQYEIYIDGGVVKKQGFIEDIIYTIKTTAQRVTEGIYQSIVKDSGFISIVRTLLVLYIVITGLMFSMGFIKMHQSELVIRVFKIAIIITLISPGSWSFFNNYFFNIFYDGAIGIADRIMSLSMFDENGNSLMPIYDDNGNTIPVDSSSAFSVYDSALQMLGKWQLHYKILALFHDWHFYLIPFIYIAIVFMLLGMLKGIVQYLTALLMTYLLMTTAPIFIIMMFFKPANELFENWLKYLVSNSLMIIVTMATVALMLSLMLESLIAFFSFDICKELLLDFNPLGFSIFKIFWWLPSKVYQFTKAVTLGNFLKLIITAAVFSVYMDHVPKLVDALSNMARAPMSGIYSAAMGAFYQSAIYNALMDLSAMNPIGAAIDRRIHNIQERSTKEDATTRDKFMAKVLKLSKKLSNLDSFAEYRLAQFAGDKYDAENLKAQRISRGLMDRPDSQKTLQELFHDAANEYMKRDEEKRNKDKKEPTLQETMQKTKISNTNLEDLTKGHDIDKSLSLKLTKEDLANLTLDGESAKELVANLAQGDRKIDFEKGVEVQLGGENITKLLDSARTLRGGSGKVSVVIHPPATSMREMINDHHQEQYSNVKIGSQTLSDVLAGLKAEVLARPDSIATSIKLGDGSDLFAHIQNEARGGEKVEISPADIEIEGRSLADLMDDSEARRNPEGDIVLEIEPAHAFDPVAYKDIELADTNMSDILSSLTKEDLAAVENPNTEITVKGVSLGEILKRKQELGDGALNIGAVTQDEIKIKDKSLSKILSGEAIERRGAK